MIRPFAFAVSATTGGGGGGGPPPTMPTVTFNPTGGIFSTTTITVNLTVAGTNVTKFRWKVGLNAYTTVNALSGNVTVHPVTQGAVLYCDALSAAGGILASGNQTYTYQDSGGGGGL